MDCLIQDEIAMSGKPDLLDEGYARKEKSMTENGFRSDKNGYFGMRKKQSLTHLRQFVGIFLCLAVLSGCAKKRLAEILDADGYITIPTESVSFEIDSWAFWAEYEEAEELDAFTRYELREKDSKQVIIEGKLPLGMFFAYEHICESPQYDEKLRFLILSLYTIGAHCCWTYDIILLGQTPRFLQKIRTGNSELVFDEQDSGGACLVYTCDDAYAYWGPGGYAGSMCPEVVLKLSSQGLMLDRDAMYRELPSAHVVEATKVEVQRAIKVGDVGLYEIDWEEDEYVWAPTMLMEFVVQFIYAGHGKKAEQFIDEVWPVDGLGDAVKVKRAISARLRESNYKRELIEWSGWSMYDDEWRP